MRKMLLPLAVFLLCFCACERETLTDPVLFCESYNRESRSPVTEENAYLRTPKEVMLFSGKTLIRLKMNDDGAICTAVVTGKPTEETASAAFNAFNVLAQPLSERVPQEVTASMLSDDPSVQTAQTKRFYYAVYHDGESVSAVQINLLLSSIPVLPSLRPSGSE